MTPFQLIDAHSAFEAATLLRAHAGLAQPIAAGGDLLGLLKEGVFGPDLPLPSILINLATASDLSGISSTSKGFRIGAMTPLATIARQTDLPPMLGEAIARIASPQLRTRTTLGGNILQRPRCMYFRHPDIVCFKKGGRGCPAVGGPSQAYPGALFAGSCHAGHPSDLAPVLIALGSRAEITGVGGERTVAVSELFRDAGMNPSREAAMAPDEVLTALVLPERPLAQAFEKVAPRLANEFSWASAAVAIDIENRKIREATIALGGIAPGPFVCERARRLVGRSISTLRAGEVVHELLPVDGLTEATQARAAAAWHALERALERALA